MNELADKIQAVINTLETLNMPSTYDNVNRVLGIYNTLVDVRNDLRAMAPAAKEDNDGKADSE